MASVPIARGRAGSRRAGRVDTLCPGTGRNRRQREKVQVRAIEDREQSQSEIAGEQIQGNIGSADHAQPHQCCGGTTPHGNRVGTGQKERAPARPRSAVSADTRAAKKRWSSHPVRDGRAGSHRPSRRAPAHRRPPTPRSVSSAEMCAIAPFCAIELQKRTVTTIQKMRDAIASRTEQPARRSSWPGAAAGRSRMNLATVGTPTASTIAPSVM